MRTTMAARTATRVVVSRRDAAGDASAERLGRLQSPLCALLRLLLLRAALAQWRRGWTTKTAHCCRTCCPCTLLLLLFLLFCFTHNADHRPGRHPHTTRSA